MTHSEDFNLQGIDWQTFEAALRAQGIDRWRHYKLAEKSPLRVKLVFLGGPVVSKAIAVHAKLSAP